MICRFFSDKSIFWAKSHQFFIKTSKIHQSFGSFLSGAFNTICFGMKQVPGKNSIIVPKWRTVVNLKTRTSLRVTQAKRYSTQPTPRCLFFPFLLFITKNESFCVSLVWLCCDYCVTLSKGVPLACKTWVLSPFLYTQWLSLGCNWNCVLGPVVICP